MKIALIYQLKEMRESLYTFGKGKSKSMDWIFAKFLKNTFSYRTLLVFASVKILKILGCFSHNVLRYYEEALLVVFRTKYSRMCQVKYLKALFRKFYRFFFEYSVSFELSNDFKYLQYSNKSKENTENVENFCK